MSNHFDDPWEAEMSRQFDERVRDLHEAPLSFDHVKGKAMKIRRTRRVAAAGGILAAAAVIIPVAVFAGQGLTDKDSGPGPADPNPTVIDPGSSGFGYLEGKTLHLANGSTVELPRRYDRATLLDDTVFASRNDDETGYDLLDTVDNSGAATEIGLVMAAPVSNSDHSVLAYVEEDGDLVVRWGDEAATLTSGLPDGSHVTAVTGGPDCAVDDCRIYVNGDYGTDPMVYDTNGGSEVVVPGAIKVNGVEGGLVAVQNESTDTGSCGGIYDLTLADYEWQTCDYFLFEPSPDAKFVEATHPYLDGFGNGWAAILDARTGKEINRLEPEGGGITETAWQDPAHLLVKVFDGKAWSVYRIGTDGTQERALGPKEGTDVTPSYILLGGS